MSDPSRLSKNQYIGKGRHLRVQRRYAESFPFHAHDYYEIEIILEGKCIHRINNREHVVERGDIIVLTPTDFHEMIIRERTKVWNISFDETMMTLRQLEIITTNSESLFRRIGTDELERMNKTLELLRLENRTNGYIRPLFEYFLSIIISDTEMPDSMSPMRRAILYIETHFRENPSLADAAKQANFSPVYFGNLFKKHTGETYINYLNSRKLSYAKKMLESGASVTESCFSSGFGSLSAFLYTFKKNMGMSPEEYKEQKYKTDF